VGIAAMGLTMSLIQSFDAVVGVIAHDASKTYGPLFVALIGLFLLHFCCAVLNASSHTII